MSGAAGPGNAVRLAPSLRAELEEEEPGVQLVAGGRSRTADVRPVPAGGSCSRLWGDRDQDRCMRLAGPGPLAAGRSRVCCVVCGMCDAGRALRGCRCCDESGRMPVLWEAEYEQEGDEYGASPAGEAVGDGGAPWRVLAELLRDWSLVNERGSLQCHCVSWVDV